MNILNSFKNRQYQLPICSHKEDKHMSFKNKKFEDLFRTKIAYNPMLFRKTGHYHIENRQYIRKQIKLIEELLNSKSARIFF